MQTPTDLVTREAVTLPYHFMNQGTSDTLFPKPGGDRPLVRGEAKTVLVADDSLTERANLTRILQAGGYRVITASSGNEAIELAREHEPDAIFLDIIMEDGDGYKACRSIKRNDNTASIPVIMVSSKSNAVDLKWAERLGASSYVVKPYSDEDILKKLDLL